MFDQPRETYNLTYDDVSAYNQVDTKEVGRSRFNQRRKIEFENPISRATGVPVEFLN